ncbi:MAG: hypothetical protein EBQ92_00800 [Proteobacteria bacterium]|nr:hypothetical protein [Pseudomonadota bacterium]
MTKPELRKFAKEQLKKAQQYHYNSEGSKEPSCSMSEDIGYYRGMIAGLRLLKKTKKVRF